MKPTLAVEDNALPFASRKAEDTPGHWLLARLGKTVLRPGGRHLTEKLVTAVPVKGSDVVEIAPGVGLTARLLVEQQPSSYVGIEDDPNAAQLTSDVLAGRGDVINTNAKQTSLESSSKDLALGEAMLTMQTDKSKDEIVSEVVRVLRPGGRYAIHELALVPDEINEEIATDMRRDLARSIKVNARPLTIGEWKDLMVRNGLVVETVLTAPMSLLKVSRVIADEGILGTLRIGRNFLRDKDARKRVIIMWKTFHKHRHSMKAVALVARKPVS